MPVQSPLPPAHQLCWDQGETGLCFCHGYVRDCLQDQTSRCLQTMSSGRVDAAAQGEAGIAAEGFVQPGRTSYSKMYNPCLLFPPAPGYKVLCRSKCAGGVCGLWPGSPVRSKSAGPFSNPTSWLRARLALPMGEV